MDSEVFANQNLVAFGTSTGLVNFHHLNDEFKEIKRSIEIKDGAVLCMAQADRWDDYYLIVGSSSGFVTIYRITNNDECLLKTKVHDFGVNCISATIDQLMYIVTGGDDQKIVKLQIDIKFGEESSDGKIDQEFELDY